MGEKSQRQKKLEAQRKKERHQRAEIASRNIENIEATEPAKKRLGRPRKGVTKPDFFDFVEPKPESIDDIEPEKPKIIWEPISKVAIEFLQSTEDEVLFAGGRGSGKSDCLLVDPLPMCSKKKFRGLIIRRTMKELRELITRAKDLYPQVYPGVAWKQQEGVFTFPSGAKIEFGYCDNMDDLEQYRGQEYTWLGIDELTQFESPEIIDKMRGSMRTTDPDIPIYCRFTSNPTGIGRLWVKERFVDHGPAGHTINLFFDTPLGKQRITRKWLHSTWRDNPLIIKHNPQYIAYLHSLPEHLRDQWLDGSWDSAEGLAFPEFRREKHTCAPFTIPSNWMRFRSCDWGYGRSLAVVHWFAVNPENQSIYLYREFVCNGEVFYTEKLNAVQFARKVLSIEAGENIKYGVIDGKTVASKRGEVGPTIEEQMRQCGLKWRHADQSKHSRIHGKQTFHGYLAEDIYTNKPTLQIFNTCTQIIKELSSLALDENNPEDVDTDMVDHAYDSARYGLTSRPNRQITPDFWSNQPRIATAPIVVDGTFGY